MRKENQEQTKRCKLLGCTEKVSIKRVNIKKVNIKRV